ncbi:MAG: DUF262 domain-containing protein [Xanthobacteraceae bacterium]
MENLTSTQMSVSGLMDYFAKGRIAVPEIQRDVVWSSDQVKELLDSISREYPCGSLILWEPRLSDKKLVKEIIRPERLEFYKDVLPKYFVIDGQQRLTALASVMLERDFLKKLEPEIADDIFSLYVNLRNFPKDIQAASDGEAYKFPWCLLNEVFSAAIKESSDYERLAKDVKKKVDQYIQRIRDYQFPVQIIQESNYPTVGKIFARVNSQGTQLTGAEIHLASIIPYWQGISAEFRRYRGDLRKSGYDLDLTFLMRVITVIACDVPQIKRLADRVADKKLTKPDLDRIWSEGKRAIDVVADTLRRGLFLDKTKLFTSKNALVPLVYYAARSRGKKLNRDAMMKYFIVSQMGGHYSAAGETVLRRDLRYMSAPGVPAIEGLQDLLGVATREARQEYRGLKISYKQIAGLPSKNVILLLMYIIMRKKGATDFGSEAAALDQISAEQLQLHHIFPFDFMMKDNKGIEYQKGKQLSLSEYREQVNDIANLTFISQAKNAGIGNAAPWEYLPNETTRELRKAHCIPESRDLWKPENFGKFLDARRKLLAQAMNSLIKSLH